MKIKDLVRELNRLVATNPDAEVVAIEPGDPGVGIGEFVADVTGAGWDESGAVVVIGLSS